MATLKDQFDLVFLDPPYILGLWEELAALADPLIAAQGLIYVEADRDLNLLKLPQTWQKIGVKTWARDQGQNFTRTQAQFLQQNLELLRVNKSTAQLKIST